jgi:lysophospholipase L1-like esterase
MKVIILFLSIIFPSIHVTTVIANNVAISPVQTSSTSNSDWLENQTILCFGDSLTHGMYVTADGEWHNVHPYSLELQKLFPSSKIIESGINGENLSQMLPRLPSLLTEHQPSLVIILGGTNDLQGKRDASSILVDLMKLHKLCHQQTAPNGQSIKTVVVTIPPAAWFDALQEGTREVVNAQIKNFAKKHLPQVALCDLSGAPEFRHVDKESEYWSADGVHLGVKGYDLFAQLLSATLTRHSFEVPKEKVPPPVKNNLR